MRRTLAFIALWFVAGAAAATVAWQGVATVSEQLTTGSHPPPLSPEDIEQALAASEGVISEGGSTGTTAAGGSTSTTIAGGPGPSSGTAGTSGSPDTSGSPGTTGTPGSGTPATTTTTTAPPVQTVTRSYDLVGGDLTLRFSPSGVTVIVATPAAGYSVDIGSSHGNGKQVEFESDDHESRVDAWWDGGPQDEVREED